MRWPWVSRYRLEFVEAQLREANAERLRLQELLLAPRTAVPVLSLAPQSQPEEKSASSNVMPFTNPFDRVEARAGRAIASGSMPRVYKAGIR
jgi:hypothetical protein